MRLNPQSCSELQTQTSPCSSRLKGAPRSAGEGLSPWGDFINGGDGSSSLLAVPSVARAAPAAAVPELPRNSSGWIWMTLAHILKGVEARGYLGAPELPHTRSRSGKDATSWVWERENQKN